MRALIVLLCIVAFILSAAVALGHDWVTASGRRVNAEWIMEHHPECCGPEDCQTVQGRVYLDAGVYRVEHFGGGIPQDQVKRSIDGKPWACADLETNELICLFLPAWGSI